MKERELYELGRRAKASKHFRWTAGMLCIWKPRGGAGGQQVMPTGARVADLPMGPLPTTFCLVDPSAVYSCAVPDIRDPATLGCILALVREAWGDPEAVTTYYGGYDAVDWGVTSMLWDEKRNEKEQQPWFSCLIGQGPTEAHALVSALAEAP